MTKGTPIGSSAQAQQQNPAQRVAQNLSTQLMRAQVQTAKAQEQMYRDQASKALSEANFTHTLNSSETMRQEEREAEKNLYKGAKGTFIKAMEKLGSYGTAAIGGASFGAGMLGRNLIGKMN